jgi:NAD-dependent dihydropyrimidine dehydrogenase PreA subunit
MIHVDQTLCAGSGICVEECPQGAITLADGKASVDNASCDSCRACIEVCPNEALTWLAEATPERATEPLSPAVVQPPVVVIPAETTQPAAWRRAVLPAVGGALSWVGREVVPRLAPLALDMLDSALEWRHSQSAGDEEPRPAPAGSRSGRKGRQRRRRRGQ